MSARAGGSLRVQVALGIVATVVLTGLSVFAIGNLGEETRDDAPLPLTTSCSLPNLSATVVTVSLTDTGVVMDGQHSRMTSGARMFLSADHTAVPHGTVSFLAINGGSAVHELIVLPLAEGQVVGTRPIGADAKVSESGSLGEASASCGEGAGDGIVPGTSSWVTLTLAPGRYELICNLPGHYAAGDFTALTVN